MRFRFLIADVMFLIVPCAIAFALYRNDPENLDEMAFAFYVAMLCLASLGAKFRRGNRRMKMFWKGYALFGWFYFVFGLQLGLNDGAPLLTRAIIGLASALLCAYATMRLVTQDPCPGLRSAEGKAPGQPAVDFDSRAA